ncbi:MAG TPA: ADP-ribosylglycohydrolase family protein [Candidatus Eisenbacteria bacterium]|nr:ADP-ribosylglycohydrolase family protein [Candidatus Eisenbacteria bacterium]
MEERSSTAAPPALRERYRGTLLGLAVGNALGSPVEFLTAAEIRKAHPRGVREIRAEEPRLPWDDDLAQAVILAEAILDHNTLTHDDLAPRLTAWFEENGRGMGAQTRSVVHALKRGMLPSEAGKRIWERHGGTPAANGVVMRCPPVAMRWPRDTERLYRETETSAHVTHPDPRCVWSAFAINLAIAEALNGRITTIGAVAEALDRVGAGPHTLTAVASVSGRGLEHLRLDGAEIGFTLKSMQVGLWCLEHAESFEESLVAVIQAGGDTDTNGAVAGAVLGTVHGAEAIPERWIKAVPGGKRLIELSDRLLEQAEASG